MNELALFTGVGGGLLGGYIRGWRTVCAVEREPYAASILMQRQNDGILPPFPIWDDVCTFDGRPWRGIVDVVSGGFPCPAFSTAARGRNLAEKDLWHEASRIIGEVQPTFFFGENVSRQAIEQAATDLNDMGYDCRGCKISAADVGADHLRERYWVLAYPHNQSQLFRKINAEMAGVSKLRPSVWQTFPAESGMDDGMAYRMDRFKAIGNGQVSIVEAAAWGTLSV